VVLAVVQSVVQVAEVLETVQQQQQTQLRVAVVRAAMVPHLVEQAVQESYISGSKFNYERPILCTN
jgi:hypothetical protein